MINTTSIANQRQTHRLRVINDFQLEPFFSYPVPNFDPLVLPHFDPFGSVSLGGQGRSCDQVW